MSTSTPMSQRGTEAICRSAKINADETAHRRWLLDLQRRIAVHERALADDQEEMASLLAGMAEMDEPEPSEDAP